MRSSRAACFASTQPAEGPTPPARRGTYNVVRRGNVLRSPTNWLLDGRDKISLDESPKKEVYLPGLGSIKGRDKVDFDESFKKELYLPGLGAIMEETRSSWIHHERRTCTFNVPGFTLWKRLPIEIKNSPCVPPFKRTPNTYVSAKPSIPICYMFAIII